MIWIISKPVSNYQLSGNHNICPKTVLYHTISYPYEPYRIIPYCVAYCIIPHHTAHIALQSLSNGLKVSCSETRSLAPLLTLLWKDLQQQSFEEKTQELLWSVVSNSAEEINFSENSWKFRPKIAEKRNGRKKKQDRNVFRCDGIMLTCSRVALTFTLGAKTKMKTQNKLLF